jgi:hypothetical protein
MENDLAKLRAAVGQDGVIKIGTALHLLRSRPHVALFEVMRTGWVVFVRPLDGGPATTLRVLSP